MVLIDCLSALHFLHTNGVIHGDIKPSNMLVDWRNRVKIGDFGLARRASNEGGSLLKGTTKYMAPELIHPQFGTVGPASDLYSLGFSAYELICGEQFESLFPGLGAFGRDKQIAWMMWHAAADRRLPEIAKVLQGVPDDIARVIQKMVVKEPAGRYPSAAEALADLRPDPRLAGAAAGATRPGGGSRPDRGGDAEAKAPLVGGGRGDALRRSLPRPSWRRRSRQSPPSNRTLPSAARWSMSWTNWRGRSSTLPCKRRGRSSPGKFPSAATTASSSTTSPPSSAIFRPTTRSRSTRSVEVAEGKAKRRFQEVRTRFGPKMDRGHIESLRADEGALVMVVDEGENRKRQLLIRVPADLPIALNGSAELDGKPVRLADLKANDRIEVHHAGDEKGRRAVELSAERLVTDDGVVRGLDRAAQQADDFLRPEGRSPADAAAGRAVRHCPQRAGEGPGAAV